MASAMQSLRCLRRLPGHEVAAKSVTNSAGFTANRSIATRHHQAQRPEDNRQMERMFTREWKTGDVYAPHDLSAAEARKWRAKKAPTTDAFDVLSLNPLDLYKNFSVMSEYVTEMGRIRPRSQTGLRPVNQRKLAKAIRRAVALGLQPSVHRHPEIIKHEKGPLDDDRLGLR